MGLNGAVRLVICRTPRRGMRYASSSDAVRLVTVYMILSYASSYQMIYFSYKTAPNFETCTQWPYANIIIDTTKKLAKNRL